MKKIKRISPRKEPLQKRSLELRKAILEAATYVLKKDGVGRFTTNRVADRAGVNIASLYQYYPNKESLLFHLVEIEWNATFESIFPILRMSGMTCRERLELFIERFYESEKEEAELREAISGAGLALERTREYKELVQNGDKLFNEFIAEALPALSGKRQKQTAAFIQNVIFGYSENVVFPDCQELKDQAETMGSMICDYFKIK